MGNALRFLYGHCCKPEAAGDSDSLGPHGVSAATVGVSALAHDLFHFEITSQVFFFLPEILALLMVDFSYGEIKFLVMINLSDHGTFVFNTL